MKKRAVGVIISLIVVLIGVLITTAIGTNYGNVKIERLKIVDADGYSVSSTLYVPETATPENPAPTMIVVPGGDTSSDIMSPWADELARRGYVVVSVDYSGQGDTEVNPNEAYWTANGTMELDTIYDYLAKLPGL